MSVLEVVPYILLSVHSNSLTKTLLIQDKSVHSQSVYITDSTVHIAVCALEVSNQDNSLNRAQVFSPQSLHQAGFTVHNAVCAQWKLSITDTWGTRPCCPDWRGVLIAEVVTQTWSVFGAEKKYLR